MRDGLYLPVIEGTNRAKRNSVHVARMLAKVGGSLDGVETEVVDLADFDFAYDGNDEENIDPRWEQITAKADGFFIVVPEYNHSFPGSLKTLLDNQLKNYNHKAVALAGVSAGPWGGVRAIESLVNVVREFGLVVSAVDLPIPFVGKLFNEQGQLQDEKYLVRAERSWQELIFLARAMKQARKGGSKK